MAFKLTVVTPDGKAYQGQADSVVAKTVLGDICILSHHADIVTVINVGRVKITLDGKSRMAACSGGLLSMSHNECTLVATTFEFAEDIDKARAEAAKKRAEDRMSADLDKKHATLAKAKIQRAMCRLEVSESLMQ